MIENFAILRPVAVADAMLVASSIAEPDLAGPVPDPAIWSAVTNYPAGSKVTRTTTHKIYQRIGAGGVDATLPEVDAALATPTKWAEYLPTNRWRKFDQANDSQSVASESITEDLTPGVRADAIAFVNVEATSIRLQELSGSGYDETISMVSRYVGGWRDYFFEPFQLRTDVVFEDLPLQKTNQLRYTISNPGGVAKVGTVLPGLSRAIGGTERDAEIGIEDYSIKSTNASTGVTTFVEKPYANLMNVELFVQASKVDEVKRLLASFRATPALYYLQGNAFASLIAYGKFNTFRIVIPGRVYAKCRMEIEGLT